MLDASSAERPLATADTAAAVRPLDVPARTRAVMVAMGFIPLLHALATLHDGHGDVPVGAVNGEVDASNVAEVGGALRSLVTNRSSVLIVDLSPTTYLDSAGINLMFALGDELRARQLTLKLVIAERSSIARMSTSPLNDDNR